MAVSSATAQGTLSRIRGSITVTNNPDLNVTGDYLTAGGINVNPEGNATDFINTLTGRVTSPAPYIPVTVTIHLNRAQSLAAAWWSQVLTSSLIGPITITPDSTTFPNLTIMNCGITAIPPQDYNGADPDYPITVSGYVIINQDLWDAA